MIRRLPPPTALLVMQVVDFADELAVHHRHAPEAPVAELLGDLPAVAEIADRGAELQLFRRPRPARRSRPSRGWSARIGRRGCAVASATPRSRPQTAARARRAGRPASPRGASSRSIPASQPQAMTEVAKPVMVVAACSAQRSVGGGDDQRGRRACRRLRRMCRRWRRRSTVSRGMRRSRRFGRGERAPREREAVCETP